MNTTLPEAITTNPPFTIPLKDVKINALYFVSLALALIVASVCILCKQWLREYQRDLSLTNVDTVRLRQLRYDGLIAWKVPQILNSLPILLQLALLLFGCGVILQLWDTHLAVIIPVAVVAFLAAVFFLFTSISPAHQILGIYPGSAKMRFENKSISYNPFRSPQAWIYYRALDRLQEWAVSLRNAINRSNNRTKPSAQSAADTGNHVMSNNNSTRPHHTPPKLPSAVDPAQPPENPVYDDAGASKVPVVVEPMQQTAKSVIAQPHIHPVISTGITDTQRATMNTTNMVASPIDSTRQATIDSVQIAQGINPVVSTVDDVLHQQIKPIHDPVQDSNKLRSWVDVDKADVQSRRSDDFANDSVPLFLHEVRLALQWASDNLGNSSEMHRCLLWCVEHYALPLRDGYLKGGKKLKNKEEKENYARLHQEIKDLRERLLTKVLDHPSFKAVGDGPWLLGIELQIKNVHGILSSLSSQKPRSPSEITDTYRTILWDYRLMPSGSTTVQRFQVMQTANIDQGMLLSISSLCIVF